MACVLEPRIGIDGNILKWDPAEIPSTKPFVNIATSTYGTLTTQGNMNFVRTRSLIYSAFHQSARYINFDIGYSNKSKWLDFLKDKWNTYANFFIGGFLESIDTIKEEGSNDNVTYAQINAKLIDYDVRFRSQNNPPQSSSSSSVINDPFTQRRDSFKAKQSQQISSLTPINTPIREAINKPTTRHTYNKRKEGKNK